MKLPNTAILLALTIASCNRHASSPITRQVDPVRINVHSSSAIQAIAFSPDGKTLAVAGEHAIKLLESKNWKERLTLSTDERLPISLAFSPDSTLLACGCAVEGASVPSVRVWEQRKGKLVASINCRCDHVNSLAFSPDGTRIATAGEDGSVKLWDTATWNLVSTLRKHSKRAEAIAYSPNGKLLASEDDSGLVVVWDPASGNSKAEFSGQDGAGHRIAFSPDGSMLASTVTWTESLGYVPRGKIVLRNTAGWKNRGELRGHTFTVSSLTFHPNGSTLVSAGQGVRMDELWCWDMESLEARFVVRYSHVQYSDCDSLAFSPDGKTLVGGTSRESICIWDWDRVLQIADSGQ